MQVQSLQSQKQLLMQNTLYQHIDC